MKLFYSPTSPFVRKVMIVAELSGLAQKIEKISASNSPIKSDQTLSAQNPLGKIPALITDQGETLYDSSVIAQYLDSLAGFKLYPQTADHRFMVLRSEALADGLLDAAVLVRYETVLRPEDKQWSEWKDGQLQKINSSLAAMEKEVHSRSGLDAGHVTTACALGYLNLRWPEFGWQAKQPKLAKWFSDVDALPAFVKTRPQG